MTELSSLSARARKFASELGYDLDQDVQRVGLLPPHLVLLDPINGPMIHITDENGADYYTARIDFGTDDEHIAASRVFAVVMNGARTKLAYWPKHAQAKELSVVRGEGWLIIGEPQTEENLHELDQTKYFMINAAITPRITLQPGTFYTFEAAKGSNEHLVVTGLSATNAEGKWEQTEILVEPGDEAVIAPGEGPVLVPDDFIDGQFD